MAKTIEIRPLVKDDDRSGFSCNPTSTAIGNRTIDAFNAAGQGVRIEAGSGRFIGFLEGALRTR